MVFSCAWSDVDQPLFLIVMGIREKLGASAEERRMRARHTFLGCRGNSFHRRTNGLLMAAITGIAGGALSVHAASTWTGPSGTTSNPTTGNWNLAGNWSPSGVPASANTTALIFSDSGTTGFTSTDDISGAFTLNSLTLNSSDTHIDTIAAGSGNSLTLDGTTPTITSSGTGVFVISAPIALNQNSAVSIVNGGEIDFTGAITGSTKSVSITNSSGTGTATVKLSGTNTFNGLTINPNVTVAAALSASTTQLGSGTVTLAGGKLALQGQQSGGNAVQQTLSLTGYNADVIYSSISDTVSAHIDNSEDFFVSGMTGSAAGSGLPTNGLITSQTTAGLAGGVKFQLGSYTANNTLRLTSSSLSGTYTLQPASQNEYTKLNIATTGSINNGTVTVTLNFATGSPSTYTYSAHDWYQFNQSDSVFGPSSNGNHAVISSGNNFSSYDNNNPAQIYEVDLSLAAGDQTRTLQSVQFSTTAGLYGISLDIMGISGLTSNALLTSSNQTYGNAVSLTADSGIDVSGSLAATVGALSMGGNKLSLTSADGTASPYSLTTGAVTLGGNATFDVKSSSGGGAGTLTLGALGDGGVPRTVTINPTNSGTVTLNAAATSLVAGTIVNVNNGTLNSNNATALGTTAQVNLMTGATFGVGASQTISSLNGSAGTVALGSNTLTIGSSDNLASNYGGVITGAGSVVKAGTGSLTLSNASTYSGGTTINNGTLILAGSTTGAVTNGPVGTNTINLGNTTGSANTALEFDSTAGRTLANAISITSGNNGTATIGGLNTSGVSNYSGNITLGSNSTAHGVTLAASNGGEVDFTGNILAYASTSAAVTVSNLSGSGSAVVKLTGANTYSGGTIVNPNVTLASGLNVPANTTLGSGTVTLAGGKLALQGQQMVAIGTQQTLTISSGFNADTIFDAATTNPNQSSTGTPIFGIDSAGAGGNALAVTGYNSGGAHSGGAVTSGIPTTGTIPSSYHSGVSFQLGSLTSNNTAYFTATGSRTLSLASPLKMTSLQFLADAQNSPSTFNVTLNFSDSSSDTYTNAITTGPWAYNPAPANLAFSMVQAVTVGTGVPFSPGGGLGGGQVFLTESDLNLSPADQSKTLSSITFTNTSLASGATAEIFAVSGVNTGSNVTAPTQAYGNNLVVTANSSIDITGSLAATMGTLGIGSNTLSITSADATTNPYSLTTGAVTLTGTTPTLNVANSTGGGPGTLAVGAVSDGGSTTTLSVNTGSVPASGFGTVNLKSAGTFQAASVVNVSGGTLLVTNTSGSATGLAGVTINAGGALGGTGTITGSVTVNAGGTIFTGLTNNTAGKTTSTLHVGSGSSLLGSTLIDLTASNTSDEIVIGGGSGTAMFAGSLVVTNPNNISFAAGQSYDLFGFGSVTGGFSLNLPTLPSNTYWNVSTLYTNGIISIGSGSGTNQWAKTTGGSWSIGTNWTNGIPDAQSAQANFLTSPTGLTSPANITLDGNHTVGQITFTNTNGYTIAQGSSGTLTIDDTTDTNGENPLIAVTAGNHAITAPVNLVDGVTVSTATNTSLTIGGLVNGDGILTNSGSGTLIVSTTGSIQVPLLASANVTFASHNSGGLLVQNVAGLWVSTGANVIVADPSNQTHANRTVLATQSLYFDGSSGAWAGQLDLGGNDMIVRNGVIGDVTDQVRSGFNVANGGYWNGQGITSSDAKNDPTHLMALGVVQNDDGTGNPYYTSFDGQPVDITDVLVKYTYYGDANLDGKIDGTDYSLIDFGFGSNGAVTGWQNGDFNYDGFIDGSDYSLIDNSFNSQGTIPLAQVAANTAEIATSGGSAVPEPTTLGLLAIGALATLGRRRRR
jgi:fibronectin-binding autotransporter adhesin